MTNYCDLLDAKINEIETKKKLDKEMREKKTKEQIEYIKPILNFAEELNKKYIWKGNREKYPELPFKNWFRNYSGGTSIVIEIDNNTDLGICPEQNANGSYFYSCYYKCGSKRDDYQLTNLDSVYELIIQNIAPYIKKKNT